MLGSTMDEGMNKTRRGYCTEYARAHISSSRQVRRLLLTLRQDIPTDTKVVNNAFLWFSFLPGSSHFLSLRQSHPKVLPVSLLSRTPDSPSSLTPHAASHRWQTFQRASPSSSTLKCRSVSILPATRPLLFNSRFQLISSLGALAESMRNCASIAENFSQIVAQIPYGQAPLNGQFALPTLPLPARGKRKAADETDGRKTKRAKKPKDPNAPKRPASSYLLFQNEVRQQLKDEHPNLPNNELLSLIAKMWKDMPREQKDVRLLVLFLRYILRLTP